jgi:hypothetical protein
MVPQGVGSEAPTHLKAGSSPKVIGSERLARDPVGG